MKKIKRFLLAILVVIVSFGLVACGTDSGSDDNTDHEGGGEIVEPVDETDEETDIDEDEGEQGVPEAIISKFESMDLISFADGDSAELVTQDIELEKELDGYIIDWKILPSTAISSEGKITKSTSERSVTLYAYLLDENDKKVSTRKLSVKLEAEEKEEVVFEPHAGTLPFETVGFDIFTEPKEAVPVYYFEEDVPSISVRNFFEMMQGQLDFEVIEDKYEDESEGVVYDYKKYIDYEYKEGVVYLAAVIEYYEEGTETLVEEENYKIEIDGNTNKVNIHEYDFFNAIDRIKQEGEVGTDMKLRFGNTTRTTELEGPLVMDLTKYDLEMKIHEDDVWMPIPVISQIILNNIYHDVYYNGNKIFSYDLSEYMGDHYTTISYHLNKNNAVGRTMSQAIKELTYNQLRMNFDLFYGNKEALGAGGYEKYLSKYKDDIINGDKVDHYRAIADLIASLDDPHSSKVVDGFYASSDESFGTKGIIGPRNQAINDAAIALGEFGDDGYFVSSTFRVTISEDKKTAIIRFDGFDHDTTSLMEEAFEEKIATVETIENVIFDVSSNLGGIVGRAWEVLGFMVPDGEPFLYSDYNPLTTEGTTTEIYADTKYYDYNYFIITSPASFSSGNMFPTLAQDNNLATIIGFRSGGGASSIISWVLPTGTIYRVSSNNVFARKVVTEVEGETVVSYESHEYGVEPDIPVPFENYKGLRRYGDILDLVNEYNQEN